MPSYMADIFEKPPGWVETPDAPKASLLTEPTAGQQDRIFAIDCEMVCVRIPFLCHPLDLNTGVLVLDRRRQGAHQGVHHRLQYRSCPVRSTCQAIEACARLPNTVMTSFSRPFTRVSHHLPSYSWSGITEAILAPVTTTLSEVQTKLLTLLSAPSFLLHSHPPRSLSRVGSESAQTLPPALHRHCAPLPPPTRPPTQTRPRVADTQVVRAGDPDPGRGRTRPRGGRSGVFGVT